MDYSQLIKKIAVAAGILILLVAAAAWLLSRPHQSGQASSTSSSTGAAFPSRTTVGISSSGSGVPASAPQETTDDFFKKIAATRVQFNRVDGSSTGAEAEIYKLYASDFELNKELYPAAQDDSIEVSFLDLNQDGVQEAIVYEDSLSFCGSGGCSLHIWQKRQGQWVKIADLLTGPDVATANVIFNGYLGLDLMVAGDARSPSIVEQYDWDGTTYTPKELVATWNGTTFTIVSP